jgi:hypothetical protein
MRNYLIIGPVRLRLSRKHLAPWGYPFLKIGGLDFLSRMNTGDLVLASYHPDWSITWRWSASIGKRQGKRPWIDRAKIRRGQWHDYYRLPFGRQLCISQQAYMPRDRRPSVGSVSKP